MEKKELNLNECTHEELCDLVSEGTITWSEWVEAQPELYEGYQDWLKRNALERNDENALRFVAMVEEDDMNAETDTELAETMTTIEKARQVLARRTGA